MTGDGLVVPKRRASQNVEGLVADDFKSYPAVLHLRRRAYPGGGAQHCSVDGIGCGKSLIHHHHTIRTLLEKQIYLLRKINADSVTGTTIAK